MYATEQTHSMSHLKRKNELMSIAHASPTVVALEVRAMHLVEIAPRANGDQHARVQVLRTHSVIQGAAQ